MKQKYEGQGLERFWRALWVFAGIGVASVTGLSLYVLWRVFV
jgi:hypothetical protein